jgi:epoxyqueuosine reductase QueG
MEKEKLRAIRGKLENRAIGMSARFFGVADLTEALEIIVEQGGDFLAAFPRSISLGIALNDSIVDQLYRHKEVGVARTYDYLYYTVNQSLDRIALHLSGILNENGFQTLLIPASDTINNKKVHGLVSHKLSARLAGLGWIGPSCLLITPELGPRVRWVTVLTNALLESSNPIPNQCGECQKCVEACPPKAFTGRPFVPSESRETRFNVQRCIDYRIYLKNKVTGVRVCGMCVQVCPVGSKEV